MFRLHTLFTLAICLLASLDTLELHAQNTGPERTFREWDRNGDGVLTKREVPQGAKSNFDRVDQNKDGKVTLQEHLAATSGPPSSKKPQRPRKRAENSKSGNRNRHTIRQAWSQEPQGIEREYFVSTPSESQESWPVTFIFHGNGGQAGNALGKWPQRLPNQLVVAAQGYEKSWNISDERSKAPDVDFFRAVVADIKQRYPKADLSRISIMGFSNGAGMVFRLLIEADETTPIQNAIPLISSMVEEQFHKGSFWKRSNDANGDYDLKATPAGASNLLTIHGTEDRVVPYHGGKRGRTAIHISAQDTAYAWARQQGFKGPQIPDREGKRVTREIREYDYPEANVTHLKVIGAGHGFGRQSKAVNDRVIQFIQSGGK
ncbi:MAG: hypothetical protein P8J33_07610 [Pirellulaceae bacterium]|nr:hypothetical protein [Pirellulaceae bacterium]